MNVSQEQEQRFSRLWAEHARRVQAYVSRHTDPDGVQDVVADTFLVAWRRLANVPTDALPWLLVVARNTAANRSRAQRRLRAVQSAMVPVARAARPADAADVPGQVRAEVVAALAALSDTEREALLLVAWDGLTPGQGAAVLGCSVDAFTKRVSRARARLTQSEAQSESQSEASQFEAQAEAVRGRS